MWTTNDGGITMLCLESGTKLVMIGDSITDCERARPIGEGLFNALGKGYVSLVDSLLQATYPERNIRVVNMGTSGNTVRDLEARWQTDVVDLKPDWLSIMIGINDVWRQFDTPWQPEWAVTLDEYRPTLERLVTQTRPQVNGLVLLTPYVIEPNPTDPMRAMMDRYGAVVRELASQYDAVFVDTQAAFNSAMSHIHPTGIAWDRIHPGQVGHMVLARVFLSAIGYDWVQ